MLLDLCNATQSERVKVPVVQVKKGEIREISPFVPGSNASGPHHNTNLPILWNFTFFKNV
jgi:hypothetical protein